MTVRIMRLIAPAMLPLASGETLLRPEPGGSIVIAGSRILSVTPR
jgi:hypothetical protein